VHPDERGPAGQTPRRYPAQDLRRRPVRRPRQPTPRAA